MDEMTEIIEIYPSKAESVKVVIYGCVFAAAGWWMIMFMPGYWTTIVGSFAILFALAGICVNAWLNIRSARRKPAAMIYDDRVAGLLSSRCKADTML